jgi:hypothetical protein
MLTLVSGALAGLVHVVAGPDHLAAVAPLAIADRRRGWEAGFTWGLGHTSGVVTVALLALLLRDVLPPFDVIALWSERLVGGALIAIGLWALRRALKIGTSAHAHRGVAHAHVHVQRGRLFARVGHAHASFLIGVLHGVAGTSHFLGVLPALALPTTNAALGYVAAFGIGSIAAMTGFGGVVGAASGPRTHRAFMLTASGLAVVVGCTWLIL